MRRLVFKLLVLVVLLGGLFFVPPPPAHADYWQFVACSEGFFDGVGTCSIQYEVCLANAGTNPTARAACYTDYLNCLSGAQSTYYGCDGDPTPQPLPVIDQARSQCMEGCNNNCADIENLGDRSACIMPCRDYCDETFPKQ